MVLDPETFYKNSLSTIATSTIAEIQIYTIDFAIIMYRTYEQAKKGYHEVVTQFLTYLSISQLILVRGPHVPSLLNILFLNMTDTKG